MGRSRSAHHARARPDRYPLLTTQTRNATNFPPPPEESPIRDDDDPDEPDAGVIVQSQTSTYDSEPPFYVQDLDADEPVYVIAVGGDGERTAPSNSGQSDFEACLVGDDGHLACEQWQVQDGQTRKLPQPTFGHDAQLNSEFIYRCDEYLAAGIGVTTHAPTT